MKKFSDRPKWKGVYCHVSKDYDKIYYITYSFKGKLIWKRIGSKCEGFKAEDARKARINYIRTAKGQKKKGTAMTVQQAWDKYHEMMETDRFKAITSEVSRYCCHIGARLGDMLLTDVTVPVIKRMQLELNQVGLQPSSVYEIISLLGRVFAYAKKCGYMGINPVKEANFKNVRVQRRRFLTVKQADQFLKECRKINKKLYHMCAFAVYSGLRINEVFQLNRDRVNIYSRELTVRTKHSKRQYKERKAIILEPLVHIVHDLLKTHVRSIKEPFFKGSFNYKQYQQAVDACGLNDERSASNRAEWFTFHSLRHTYGTLLAEAGVPAITIKEMMGHETLEATMIYTHVSENQMHEAASKLEGLWKKQLTSEQKSNLRRVA